MEIGPLTAPEWPWLLARSAATGWAQLTPLQQGAATPAGIAARAEQMLSQALAQPGGAAVVAREQGIPAGYLVAAGVPDELTGVPTGLFLDIWMEPQWRGKGVSSLLTAAGEAHCRALGLRLVRRIVAAHNAPSLRHAAADGCQVERLVLVKAL